MALSFKSDLWLKAIAGGGVGAAPCLVELGEALGVQGDLLVVGAKRRDDGIVAGNQEAFCLRIATLSRPKLAKVLLMPRGDVDEDPCRRRQGGDALLVECCRLRARASSQTKTRSSQRRAQ